MCAGSNDLVVVELVKAVRQIASISRRSVFASQHSMFKNAFIAQDDPSFVAGLAGNGQVACSVDLGASPNILRTGPGPTPVEPV